MRIRMRESGKKMADNQEQSETDRSTGGKGEEFGLGIKPVSGII